MMTSKMPLLRIHEKRCSNCKLCTAIFPGLPDDGFGSIRLPIWTDREMLDQIEWLVMDCPEGAINVEDI